MSHTLLVLQPPTLKGNHALHRLRPRRVIPHHARGVDVFQSRSARALRNRRPPLHRRSEAHRQKHGLRSGWPATRNACRSFRSSRRHHGCRSRDGCSQQERPQAHHLVLRQAEWLETEAVERHRGMD